MTTCHAVAKESVTTDHRTAGLRQMVKGAMISERKVSSV